MAEPRSSEAELLLERVAAAAGRDGLFAGIRRLIVGCSGGGDSTALLDVLVRLAAGAELNLAVAHLHHGWRGEAAEADLDAVRRAAESYELPFFEERAGLDGAPGSKEDAARRARLRFFEQVAASWPADAVALGHSADDQLETVILNLTRGAGRRGLAGMRRRSQVGGLLIVRPLLDERRQTLREYALERSLTWREDASNNDISLSRNRLRHRLLSELQQINAGAVGNVARMARLLAEEEDWLEELAAETFARLRRTEEYAGGVALSPAGLAELALPLQRRVVRRAIEEVRGHSRGIGFEHVERVIEAIGGAGEAGANATDLPGVRLRVENDRIRLLPLSGRHLGQPHSG